MKTEIAKAIRFLTLAIIGLMAPLHADEEINITSFPANPNFIPILDGDITPRMEDGTDFGQAAVTGGSITRTFRIKNNGNENLTILNGNTGNSPHFAISGLPLPTSPITPGASRNFFITFNPTTDGQHTTTVEILNSDSDETLYDFTVTGEGLGSPEIIARGKHHTLSTYNTIEYQQTDINLQEGTLFTSTDVGGSSTNQFQIQNTGDGSLTYTVDDGNSPHFRITGVSSNPLFPALTDNFNIIFEPQDYGIHEATITISNNDSNESNYTFKVRGTGIAPDIFVRGGTSLNLTIPDGDVTPRISDGTDFGSRDVSAGSISHTFQVRNSSNATEALTVYSARITGTHQNQFSIIGLPFPGNQPVTVAQGASDPFTISFNPSSAGQKTAMVEILSDDPNETPYNFEITGLGTADPVASVSGSAPGLPLVAVADGSMTPMPTNGTAFADTDVGGITMHVFEIENRGEATLTCSPPPNGQFRIVGLDSSLEPGEKDSFNIQFQPTSPGLHRVTINLDTNDPNADPYNFIVEGTAIDNEITVLGGESGNQVITNGTTSTSPTNGTHFGTLHRLGESEEHTFLIRNEANSNKALTIQSVDIFGADANQFSTSGAPAPGAQSIKIAPGVSFPFTVTFDPSGTGLKSATVRILNDDSNETPYTFQVSGTGINGPNLRVTGSQDPALLPYTVIAKDSTTPLPTNGTQFDTTIVGQTDRNYLRIWNAGNQELTHSVVSSNSTEFIVRNVNSPLDPIREDIVHIDFSPTSPGTKTSTITINSNDADEPSYSFLVRGTAVGPEIDVRGGTANPPIEIILNGDESPSNRDGTLFDDTNVTNGVDTNNFRIINQGTSPLTILTGTMNQGDHFTISGLPAAPSNVIPPRGSFTFKITFNPQWDGVHNDTVRLVNTDTDESMFEFDVRGTGLGTPDIALEGRIGDNLLSQAPFGNIGNGSTLTSFINGTEFENTKVGEFTKNQFRIRNEGDGILTYNYSSDNPEFSILEDSFSQFPGEQGILLMRFTPSGHGERTANITITSNDPNESPYRFKVSGVGLAPELDVFGGPDLDIEIPDGSSSPSPTNFTDFGLVNPSNEIIIRRFKLSNPGNEPLQFVSASDGNSPHFEIIDQPSSASFIAPLGLDDQMITIAFDPTSEGTKTATITILSNDPDETPYTFVVSGEGSSTTNEPDLEIRGGNNFSQVISSGDTSPSNLDFTDFGTVQQGSAPVSRTFQMRNTGGANLLDISGESVLNPSAVVTGENSSLAPGLSDEFTITFTPNTPGLQVAIISFDSNDPNESPYVFLVQLEVTPNGDTPPSFSSFDLTPTGGATTFDTLPGSTYKLTTSTSLEGSWVQVPGTDIITGDGNPATITFTPDPSADPKRFYRLERE